MTSADIMIPPEDVRVRSAGDRGRRAARGLSARHWAAFVILGVLVVAAVAAPLLVRHTPLDQKGDLFQKPSGAYWLGTDDLGRDVMSRLIYGARVSLLAGLMSVSIGLALGVPLGLLAGFKGGWIDAVLMRVVDTFLAFPGLVLVIGITASLGASLYNSMVAVGVLFAPAVARLLRSQVLAVRGEQYIDLALAYGASSWRIVGRHVIPNAIQPVLVQASTMFGFAMLAEAGLSFLGLGVQPPDPSWGSMLARAYGFMSRAPLQIAVPGITIMLAVFAFNAVGDLLQERLDPRRRGASDE
jgi:peptide/nickel transport system permease protein